MITVSSRYSPPRRKVKEGNSIGHSAVSNSLQPNGLCSSPGSCLCPWNSPDKNTGVGCHSLLQGIFLTQGSIPGLPHCRQILYRLRGPSKPVPACGSVKHLKKRQISLELLQCQGRIYLSFP